MQQKSAADHGQHPQFMFKHLKMVNILQRDFSRSAPRIKNRGLRVKKT